MKGDPQQALALVKEAPLQRRKLGAGLQQCLYLRAVSSYLLGRRAAAVADIDRLYAVNPEFPSVIDDKAAIENGSFVLSTPAGQITAQGLSDPPPAPPPGAPPAPLAG